MAEHILLIEDDEHLSAMLGEYLGARGFTVTACATASDGLKLVRQGGFAALVLDIMLPDLACQSRNASVFLRPSTVLPVCASVAMAE